MYSNIYLSVGPSYRNGPTQRRRNILPTPVRIFLSPCVWPILLLGLTVGVGGCRDIWRYTSLPNLLGIGLSNKHTLDQSGIVLLCVLIGSLIAGSLIAKIISEVSSSFLSSEKKSSLQINDFYFCVLLAVNKTCWKKTLQVATVTIIMRCIDSRDKKSKSLS